MEKITNGTAATPSASPADESPEAAMHVPSAGSSRLAPTMRSVASSREPDRTLRNLAPALPCAVPSAVTVRSNTTTAAEDAPSAASRAKLSPPATGAEQATTSGARSARWGTSDRMRPFQG